MSSKASKILGLFVLFVIGFVIFVARILDITTSDRFKTTAQKKELDTPLRGEIVTSDNYKLAISQKTYTVAVNPENIKPESFELFVKLFSIYSSIPEKELRQMLKSDKRVILVDKVDGKSAKNFRQLSAVLDKMKIFVPKTVGAKTFRYGLEIVENEFLRFYPYGDFLEPVLGYAKLETMEGLLGVEKFYDNYMSPDRVGYIQGYKDVGGNLILNEKIDKMLRSDGLNLRLNVNLGLQKQLEKAQQEFDRLLEMSLELDESTPFLDDKLRKLSGKIKILKANIAESTDGKGEDEEATKQLTAQDLLIKEYDDILTARIIEKVIVHSRQEIEIYFIGGYTQKIDLI